MTRRARQIIATPILVAIVLAELWRDRMLGH